MIIIQWAVLLCMIGCFWTTGQANGAEPEEKSIKKHPYFGKHPKEWSQVKTWVKASTEIQWESPKPFDFSLHLPDVKGKKFALSSLRGHLILMTRWATWCEPCKAGLKQKKRLQQRIHPLPLQIVGIGYQKREEIQQYHRTQPKMVQFPISLIDEKGDTMDWIPGFEYPTTLIIDPWGWSWSAVYLRGNWNSPQYLRLFSHLLRWYVAHRTKQGFIPSTRPAGKYDAKDHKHKDARTRPQ